MNAYQATLTVRRYEHGWYCCRGGVEEGRASAGSAAAARSARARGIRAMRMK